MNALEIDVKSQSIIRLASYRQYATVTEVTAPTRHRTMPPWDLDVEEPMSGHAPTQWKTRGLNLLKNLDLDPEVLAALLRGLRPGGFMITLDFPLQYDSPFRVNNTSVLMETAKAEEKAEPAKTVATGEDVSGYSRWYRRTDPTAGVIEAGIALGLHPFILSYPPTDPSFYGGVCSSELLATLPYLFRNLPPHDDYRLLTLDVFLDLPQPVINEHGFDHVRLWPSRTGETGMMGMLGEVSAGIQAASGLLHTSHTFIEGKSTLADQSSPIFTPVTHLTTANLLKPGDTYAYTEVSLYLCVETEYSQSGTIALDGEAAIDYTGPVSRLVHAVYQDRAGAPPVRIKSMVLRAFPLLRRRTS